MLWGLLAVVGFVGESAVVVAMGRSVTRRWEQSVPVLPPPVFRRRSSAPWVFSEDVVFTDALTVEPAGR